MSGWGDNSWGDSYGDGPARTIVTDTLYAPNGATLTGTMMVATTSTWQSADGFTILQGFSLWVPIVDGVFCVGLVPNAGSTPASTYKVRVEATGNFFTQTWSVPSSDTPVNLAAVVVDSD